MLHQPRAAAPLPPMQGDARPAWWCCCASPDAILHKTRDDTRTVLDPAALPTFLGMPDKQLPALPTPERRAYERPAHYSMPVHGLHDRSSAPTSAQHGRHTNDDSAARPHTSSYLGASFALAPLASFPSASSLSEPVSAPIGDTITPMSSTPTQTVSPSRTSGAPTLSVALPSPYLLLASSQTSTEFGAPTDTAPRAPPMTQVPVDGPNEPPHTSVHGMYADAPASQTAHLDAPLPLGPLVTPQDIPCVEPPNIDMLPPIPEDWAAGLVQPCLIIEVCVFC